MNHIKNNTYQYILGLALAALYIVFTSDNNNVYEYLLIISLVLIAVIFVALYRWHVRRSADSAVLMGHGLLSEDIIPATSGKIGGFNYRIIASSRGRKMFIMDFGYNSDLHVVVYGDKSKLNDDSKVSLHNKWIRPVELEGNFPEYFHMYCTPGREIELLQMFSPDTMMEFIEFCRAYDVEIAYESLYISQAGDASDPDDTTGMLDDAKKFVKDNAFLFKRLEPQAKIASAEYQ